MGTCIHILRGYIFYKLLVACSPATSASLSAKNTCLDLLNMHLIICHVFSEYVINLGSLLPGGFIWAWRCFLSLGRLGVF